MSLLTKVAKGVAFGDVSNQAVRNILTELSKSLYGGITEIEMEDTMEYFDWECPYTGIPLKKEIEDKTGNYATDHIYPQNRKGCGLNVKGNLIIVSKEANKAKKGLPLKQFMEEDSEFWKKLGIDKPTRIARLKKIEKFQEDCGYDPDKIRAIVAPLLDAHYNHIRNAQELCIENLLTNLDSAGIHTLARIPSIVSETASIKPSVSKTIKRKSVPELVFSPSDEHVFKSELLTRKKAHFVLTYSSGKIITSPWNVSAFNSDSNLKGNIQSRPFWRNKTKEGLIKVEVYID